MMLLLGRDMFYRGILQWLVRGWYRCCSLLRLFGWIANGLSFSWCQEKFNTVVALQNKKTWFHHSSFVRTFQTNFNFCVASSAAAIESIRA